MKNLFLLAFLALAFPCRGQYQQPAIPSGAAAGLTNDVWITSRTDGLTGTGTRSDPFDGSTQVKFDAVMSDSAKTPVNSHIHLGPGTFQTKVDAGAYASGFLCRAGWAVEGAGKYVTTVQMVGNIAGQHHGFYAFTTPDNASTDGVTIKNLTVDCNYTGLSATADTTNAEKNFKTSGIFLYGSNNIVESVRVINSYGSVANGQEQFAIGLSAPTNTDSNHSEIKFCQVEAPVGNYGAPYAIFGNGSRVMKNARVFGNYAAGLNNGLNGGFTTGGVNIASVKDLVIEGNTFVDTAGIFYWDTGSVDGLYARNNTVVRGFFFGAAISQTGGTPANVEISGNTIHMQNRVAGGRTWGILFLSTITSATNIRVEDNTIYFHNDGSGYYEFASIGISQGVGVRIANNITDAANAGVGGITGTGLTVSGNRTHSGGGIPELPDLGVSVSRKDSNINGGLRLTGTTASAGAYFVYNTSAAYTIASGDRLQYEVYCDEANPSMAPAVKFVDGAGATVFYGSDQNSIPSVETGDITSYAKGQWYWRDVDLTAGAGDVTAALQILEGVNVNGAYKTYLRNVKVVGSNGITKIAYYTTESRIAGTLQTSGTVTSATATPNWRGGAIPFSNAGGSSVEGALQPFTDSTTATWGATITGGGSNHVLGYYDGTNWTVMGK